ncbi:MAG: hypothetical protein RLZZ584_2492, partial [Pseudomonadota bacterium]
RRIISQAVQARPVNTAPPPPPINAGPIIVVLGNGNFIAPLPPPRPRRPRRQP